MLVRAVMVVCLVTILAGSSWWPGQGVEHALAESEVEQPPYDVFATLGDVEIRHYGPRLAAETDLGGAAGIEAGQGTAFMRLAGIVQIALSRSTSAHVAPITSPVRAAVRIVNSSASAATASRLRSLPTNSGRAS